MVRNGGRRTMQYRATNQEVSGWLAQEGRAAARLAAPACMSTTGPAALRCLPMWEAMRCEAPVRSPKPATSSLHPHSCQLQGVGRASNGFISAMEGQPCSPPAHTLQQLYRAHTCE